LEFHSYCGGLPAPECSGNPLGYKFSWSSRGVLLALLNAASYLSEGRELNVSGKELMGTAKPYFISPAFAFVAYPNRNSVPFREFYNIPEAKTVVRGTLRYQGFPAFIKALVDIGFLDGEEKGWLKDAKKGMKWIEVTARALGVQTPNEKSVVEKIRSLCAFPDAGEESRIVSGLKWIGLFSDEEEVIVRGGNLLDSLCAQLEKLMAYEDGERDLVMLQHKFIVEWKDGKKARVHDCYLLI
jgi:saccharopine dehydrogenase-like NADP-dependent oxidoreductase